MATHAQLDLSPPLSDERRYAYFDYNGSHLNILNDWLYNDEKPVQPECYNLFNAWTGGGDEQWVIKVYGDGNTSVELNGVEQLDPDSKGSAGRVGWGISPRVPDRNHSIFELSFAASPGGFGVRLSDPGPRFECGKLETDPKGHAGTASEGGPAARTWTPPSSTPRGLPRCRPLARPHLPPRPSLLLRRRRPHHRRTHRRHRCRRRLSRLLPRRSVVRQRLRYAPGPPSRANTMRAASIRLPTHMVGWVATRAAWVPHAASAAMDPFRAVCRRMSCASKSK